MSDGYAEAIESQGCRARSKGPWWRPSVRRALALSVGVHLVAVAILVAIAVLAPPSPRIVWVELSASDPADPSAVRITPAGGSPRPASPRNPFVSRGAAGAAGDPAPSPLAVPTHPVPAPTGVADPPLPAPKPSSQAVPSGGSPAADPALTTPPRTGMPALSGFPAAGGAGATSGAGSGSLRATGSGRVPGSFPGNDSAGSPSGAVSGRPVPGAAMPGDGTGAVPPAPRLLRERIQSRVAYPPESIRQEEEGEVLLRVLVGDGGSPREIRLAKSSGVRRLDEAARRGVSGAAPLPSTPGWYEVPVRFSLR